MKFYLKALCAICLMNIFWTMPVHSVPAFPKDISYTQPDGTTVTLRLRGDEHRHWIETPQGYLLEQADNGYMMYAKINDNGKIVASKIPYAGNDAAAATRLKLLKANSLPSVADTKASQSGNSSLQLQSTFPSTGKNKLLMLLVNFADTETTFQPADFDALMNAENYNGTGSFHDFYMENSYGQLDIEVTVIGWIQLSRSKSMYSTEDMTDLISEALITADSQFGLDLTQFDNDGDGELDGLSIIHQGMGQESSADYSDIWSHSSEVQGIYLDGIQVRTYTIQPELLRKLPTPQMSTVGVLCHEFGHNLGAPDFYDVDYESNGYFEGTGEWDLMAGGNWNEYLSPGDSPAHYNMWQKIQFGWVDPIILNGTANVSDIPAASSQPAAYLLPTMRDGDYYIAENRQQEGFDRAIPGHGLILYHADENRMRNTAFVNTVNSGAEQGLYTVCASASSNPGTTPASYGDINSAGAPFPGTSQKTAFSENSTPSYISNDGKPAYSFIDNISENNGLVSFTYNAGDIPAPVQNFTAAARRGIVTLSWEAPTNSDVQTYRVFRNNSMLAETTETSFVDNTLASTSATYQVDVLYNDGKVSPFEEQLVVVPGSIITNMSTSVNENNVVLRWDLNTHLSRSSDGSSDLNIIYQYLTGSEMDVAQRFNASDLKAYIGYEISVIKFLPLTDPANTSYKVCVWRSLAGNDEFELISERNASEYASGRWNEKKLLSPVTIEAGYDYLIGINVNTTIGSVLIVCDNSTPVNDLGNIVRIGGEDWSSDMLEYNVFLGAELSAPTIDESDFVAGEQPEFDGDYDPMRDTYYPVGFNIYRDDELIGFSSTSIYIDENVVGGTHKYGIACLYEGNNESRLIERSLYVSGVESSLADTPIAISSKERSITVTTEHEAMVHIYTADGKVISTGIATAGETSFQVPECGLYLVKAEYDNEIKIEKIIVKQ